MDLFDTTIKRICVNNRTLYLKISSKNDSCNITIVEGDNIWVGVVTRNLINENRKQTLKNSEEYFQTLKDLTSDNNIYDFSANDSDTATFTWKSGNVGTDCAVPLHRNNSGTKEDMINFMLRKNKKLREDFQNANKRNELLDSEIKKHELELQKQMEIKMSAESNLYGKFALLMYAKKRRIALLNEIMEMINKSE